MISHQKIWVSQAPRSKDPQKLRFLRPQGSWLTGIAPSGMTWGAQWLVRLSLLVVGLGFRFKLSSSTLNPKQKKKKTSGFTSILQKTYIEYTLHTTSTILYYVLHWVIYMPQVPPPSKPTFCLMELWDGFCNNLNCWRLTMFYKILCFGKFFILMRIDFWPVLCSELNTGFWQVQ